MIPMMQPFRVLFARTELLLVPLVCFCVMSAFVGAALFSEFSWTDDHEVISFIMAPESLAHTIQVDFLEGRFRPLYYALRHLQYHVFGITPFYWHLFVFGVGVTTLVALYALVRRFAPPGLAALAVALVFLYPSSSAIWYRLGPQETLGMLLIVLALLMLVRGQYRGFVLLSVLTMYYKETFALLMPALLMLRLAYAIIVRRESVRSAWFDLFTLAAFGVVPLALMALLRAGDATGYGLVPRNMLTQNVINNLVAMTLPVAFMTPIFFAVLGFQRYAVPVLVILLLWMVPQAVVHGDVFVERYYWPSILAPIITTPVALWALRAYPRVLTLSIALLLLPTPVSYYHLSRQTEGAARYVTENAEFQETMRSTAAAQPARSEWNYPLSWQVESRWSTVLFLRLYGYQGPITFGEDCEGLYCDAGLVADP